MDLKVKVELPQNASTYRVMVNGAEIAVLDYSPLGVRADSAPTVQMVHGFTGSKEDFSLVGPLIAAAGFRVVAYDHRGNHQSSHTPGHYDLAQLAEDVVGINAALGIERPHLLGHSFGGVVTQAAVLAHPDAFASLTLFCSGPGLPLSAGGWVTDMHHFLQGKTMFDAWKFLVENQDHGINYSPDPDIESLRASRWIESDSEAIVEAASILITAADYTDQLAQLEMPMHVVYGEFDDAWALSEQNRLAEVVGGVVSVIPNAGHCPNEERPEETAECLLDYWKAL